MPIGLLFWILMILWIVLDVRSSYPYPAGMAPYYAGRSLLLVILLGLLGWHEFGPALRG